MSAKLEHNALSSSVCEAEHRDTAQNKLEQSWHCLSVMVYLHCRTREFFLFFIKRARTCHLLCKRPRCYHSTSKTHVRDRIFKLSSIHASVIQWFIAVITEFNESSGPFRKNIQWLRSRSGCKYSSQKWERFMQCTIRFGVRIQISICSMLNWHIPTYEFWTVDLKVTCRWFIWPFF